ncbi:unnamed protein product, partial [Prunus brigantina]
LGLFSVPNQEDEAVTGRESSVLCECKLRVRSNILFKEYSRSAVLLKYSNVIRKYSRAASFLLCPGHSTRRCLLPLLRLFFFKFLAEDMTEIHGHFRILMVHHGGAGTTAAGLKAACPTTIVPFFGDQPFWEERVHARGVGPAPIPADEFSLEKLVDAIHFCQDSKNCYWKCF